MTYMLMDPEENTVTQETDTRMAFITKISIAIIYAIFLTSEQNASVNFTLHSNSYLHFV